MVRESIEREMTDHFLASRDERVVRVHYRSESLLHIADEERSPSRNQFHYARRHSEGNLGNREFLSEFCACLRLYSKRNGG